MAADTSEEKVVLSAVDQFTAVFKQAKQSVDQLKQALEFAKDTLAGIGVTVGAGAFVEMYHQTLQATAALNDMSQQAGASVEGLSAIQRVAKIGGQDFSGFVNQLGLMVKGLKQQGEEGTKAGAAFAYLGIQTKDANGRFRDTSVIVAELAQKLALYEGGGNKVALVQDALGKGAERYIPLLEDIAKNTDYLATVTGKQAEQANEAEKNMRRLQQTMADGRQELVNRYTPALVEFTERLLAATRAAGGLLPGVATMFSAQPAINADRIGQRLQEIDEILARKEKTGLGAKVANIYTGGLYGTVSGMFTSDLENEREYLRAVQRQQALALVGEGNLDARDLRGRQGALTLDYQSPDTKKGRRGMSPYDSTVLELQQREAISATGESEFMKQSLAIKAGKYDTIDQVTGQVVHLRDAEKQYLLQLAASADTERQYKELREEKLKADLEIAKNDDAAAARRRANFVEVQAQYKTEREIAEDRYNAQLDQLRNSTANQEEFNDYSMRLWMRYQEDLTRIQDEETKKRYNISQVYRQLDMQSAGSFFGYMSLLMKTKSRELFEVGKAGAIAKAIVDTYGAAAGAYNAMASIPFIGPVLGAAAAAAAIAAGLANVRAIQSTNYGASGGAVGTYPASPVTGLPSGSPVPQSAISNQQQSPQTTIVHVHGTKSEQALIRSFVEALNENSRDGGRIFVAS